VVVGLLGIAGLVGGSLYPVMTDALTSAGRASPDQIGRMATAEFLAFALTALFAKRVLSLSNLRGIATIAAIVQIVAVLATTRLSGELLSPVRAVFGGAAGVLVWIQYEFIARAHRPARLTGIYTAAAVVTAIALSWIGPGFVSAWFGVDGLIMAIGSASVIALLAAPFGPRQLRPWSSVEGDVASDKPTAESVLLLVSIVAWSCWMTLLWVYAGPLSQSLAVSELASRAFVGTSLVLQILGAAAGAAWADRMRFRRVLGGGLTISVIVSVLLWAGVGSYAFIACFGVYGFLSYFLVPFYVQGLAALDVSRRSVVLFPGAQYLGAGVGPLAASFVVSEGDYEAGMLVGSGFVMAALLSLWGGLWLARRRAHATLSLDSEAAARP
jgi:hypothetical protein